MENQNIQNPAPEETKKPKKEHGKVWHFFHKIFESLDSTLIFGGIIAIISAIIGGILGHSGGYADGMNDSKAEHTREFFKNTNKVTKHMPIHVVDDESNTDVVIMDTRQYEDLNRQATRNVNKIIDALNDNPPPEVPAPEDVSIPDDEK